jgi:hypothetical protein
MITDTGRPRWRTQSAPHAALPGPGRPGARFIGHHDIGIAIGKPRAEGTPLRLVHSGRPFLLRWADHARWFAWDPGRGAWRLRCCVAGRCGRGT